MALIHASAVHTTSSGNGITLRTDYVRIDIRPLGGLPRIRRGEARHHGREDTGECHHGTREISLMRVAPDGAAPPAAQARKPSDAFRAEDGWGCPATGPASANFSALRRQISSHDIAREQDHGPAAASALRTTTSRAVANRRREAGHYVRFDKRQAGCLPRVSSRKSRTLPRSRYRAGAAGTWLLKSNR